MPESTVGDCDASPNERVTFETVYRAQWAGMVRLAWLLSGSREVAEDLVHDAFLRLDAAWASVDDPGPYLRQIVVNDNDPTSLVAALRAAGADPREVGHETIRGVATKRFHAEVHSPAEKYPVDIWIGGGKVLRIANGPDFTEDFTDFGVPVKIVPPPAQDTDYSGFLNGKFVTAGGPAPGTVRALPGTVEAHLGTATGPIAARKGVAVTSQEFAFSLRAGVYVLTGTSPNMPGQTCTSRPVTVNAGMGATADLVCVMK